MPSPQVSVLANGSQVDAGILSLLTRAEVRESDCEPTVLALRFRLLQRADGEFSPVDDQTFAPGTPIALELTAPGGLPARLFHGYVTHVRPHFETIPGNAYVEILGMDAAVLLDSQDRVASYPNATDSEAANEILSRYNITVTAQDTAARHEEDRMLLVQRGTDWSFLLRLARRNGYRIWFEYNQTQGAVAAWFGPPDLQAAPQADLIILQGGENLRWADLQLISTGPVRYKGAAIDPIAKRVVRGDGASSLDLLGDSDLGAEVEGALQSAGVEEATGLLRDPQPLDAAIGAEASGGTDAARFAIELRGELDPALYRGLLRAHRTVLVRGIGRRFSGKYYVQTVRTTLSDGALSQSFVAVRNATGQTGQESFGQSAEEVPPA